MHILLLSLINIIKTNIKEPVISFMIIYQLFTLFDSLYSFNMIYNTELSICFYQNYHVLVYVLKYQNKEKNLDISKGQTTDIRYNDKQDYKTYQGMEHQKSKLTMFCINIILFSRHFLQIYNFYQEHLTLRRGGVKVPPQFLKIDTLNLVTMFIVTS